MPSFLFGRELYYTSIVTVAFLFLYAFIKYQINKTKISRLKSIKKREINDAVETDSPIADQEENLKEQGIIGVEERYSFMHKALPLAIIFLWFIFVVTPYLGQLPTIYISLFAAIISVIVGVSLRPFLENLFSGLIIFFFKSIRIGDTVRIDEHYGLIEEIGLTFSVLKQWDWNRIIIPNSKLLEKKIENFTIYDTYIWANVEFFISPDTNIKNVEKISIEVAKNSKYFNQAEDPAFWVMAIEKDAIKCWVAAWANSPSDAWELRHDIRTKLIDKFQQEKIQFQKLNYSNIVL